MNAAIIDPNGCKNCKHRALGEQGLECHFGPPTSHPVFAAGADGKPVVGAIVTLWPIVQPNWKCYQHDAQRIVAPILVPGLGRQ